MNIRKNIAVALLAFLIVVGLYQTGRSQAADTLANGLVGFWKFDSLDTGALTTPDSSGQNNFARVGTSTSLASGKFGSAIRLNSSSAGQFIEISQAFRSDSWAISTWINPELPMSTTTPYFGLYTILSGDTGTQLIGVQKDGVYMYTTKLGSYDFTANTGWRHIVVSYDGMYYNVYVDGKALTPVAQPNIISANLKRYLGVKNPGATNNPFKGLLDETRLYSRALTVNEVTALYNNTTNIVSTPVSAPALAQAAAPAQAASTAQRPSTILFKPNNTSPKDLFLNIQNEIDSRIGSLAANDSTKNLWVQPRGNGSGGWKKSTTAWAGDIDWSGISPWNNDFNTNIYGYYKAGTLVSPRHLIFASHFRIANGSSLIFIDRNGDMVTRKIADFRSIPNTDISIASLDSDVPETVAFYPVFKKSDLQIYLKDGSTDTSLNLPFVLFDRDDHIVVRSTNKNRFFDPAVTTINHDIAPSGKRAEFNEDLVLGDSGNPAFVLVGGQPVLIFTNFDYKSSSSLSYYFDQINAAMTSLGGGYQLSTIDLSGFTKPTITSTPAPAAPAAPADGLLGYWKFDSVTNGNTPNSVTGGFTGGVTGAISRAGKFANSLYFDNTSSPQYVTIANSLALPQWTLSVWINPDVPIPLSVAPFYNMHTILSGDTDISQVLIRNNGVYLYDRLITPYNFSANPGWHHIAVSYDGTRISATIDNTTTASRVDINPLALGVRKRVIGSNTPFSTLPENQNKFGFKGYIDEVRLFNRVVPTSEFATIFGNTFPPAPQITLPTTPMVTNLILNADKDQYSLEQTVKLSTTFDLAPEWASWIRNQNRTQGEATFIVRSGTNNAIVSVPIAFSINDTKQTITYDWAIPNNPALAGQTYTVTVEVDDGRNNGLINTTKQFTTLPVTITPAPASDSLNLDSGLFGYWKFDSISNGTTPDSSTNNNPGVLVNGPTLDAGKFGQSLIFGANNVLTGVDTTKGFGSPQWAVSLWIKPEVPVPTGAPFNSLLTFLSMDRDLVQNRARILNITKDGVYVYTDKIVNYNFNANPGWHHIAINYDGSKVTAVVDNSVKGSIDFPSNPLADSRVQRRIGSVREGTVHGFKGNIDEVRIYNRQLSLREIATLYDSNAATVPATQFTATKVYPPATLPAWTRYTNIQINLNRLGWCKAATTPGLTYEAMPIKFNDVAGMSLHHSILSVKPGNSYTYYVQCIDKTGNKIAQEIPVTFSVQSDRTAPNIIEVSHSAVRDTTAEIVWTTEELANSRVEYWERGTSAKTTVSDQAYGYPHAILLTGLKPNTTYDYTVSSADKEGNRSTSAQRSFSTRGNAARTYYIAPEGSDANDGLTLKTAFKTFEKARDVIRTVRPLPAGGIQVLVKGGLYARTTPFVLSATDSGTADAPIRYRALDATPVRISGAIPVTGFTANTNPRIKSANVVQASLTSLGITDFGTRVNSGAYIRTGNSPLELFFKDEPMILARYPNKTNGVVQQALEWLNIVATDGKQTFSTTDTRPSTWASFSNIWVQGNWYFNHRHTTLAVTNIARNGGQYTITAPGDPTGMKTNRPFFFMNVPEELDQPGEYYVDTATGMLYFYPPGGINSGQAYVSVANDLVDMNGTKYTTFTGIIFENARGKAIDMDRDTEFNMIENSVIRNVSIGAVIAGKQNGIWGSKIYNTEDNGVILYGGKDRTLEGGYNYVVNNEIYNVATLNKSYRAAVNVTGTDVYIGGTAAGPSRGVANRVRYNYIHNAPHYGIVALGNNHIIDSNRIEKTCLETIDCGAIYIYSVQPQWRGTLVKYNDISDVYGFDYENKYELNAVGIYTDGAQSGVTIYGNILHNLDTGILQNLGRDNIIENNIITGTNEPLHVNAVGMNLNGKQYPIKIVEVSNTTPVVITMERPHNNILVYETSPNRTVIIKNVQGATGINGTWNYEIVDDYRLRLLGTSPGPGEYTGGGVLVQDTVIPEKMAAYEVDKPPYSTFYPELTTMLDEPDYAEPLGTYYIKNAIYGNKVTNIEETRVGSRNKASLFWLVNEKLIKFDPSNVSSIPFTIGNYAGLYAAGLSQIPTNQIGLIKGDTLPPVVVVDPPANPVPTTKLTNNLTITTDKTSYAEGQTVKMTITFSLDSAWVKYLTAKGQTQGEMAFNANAQGSVMQKTIAFNLNTTPITQTYDWVIPSDSSAAGKTYTVTAEVYDAERLTKETKAAPSITIVSTKINTAPTVKAISVSTNVDGQVSIAPDGTDGEGDTLTYSLARTALTYGNILKATDGTFRYTLTNKATNGVTDTVTYTATDGKLTSAPATITINIPKVVASDTDKDGVPDSFDICSNTPATLKAKIDKYGCPKPLLTRFDIKPATDTVSLKSIVNAVLGRKDVGEVKFNQPIDLTRDSAELDVDSNILISAKRVEVRASNIPELNKPATITLYGVTEKNPKILRNGVVCPPTQCVVNSFKDGVLTFTVSGF